MTLDEIRIVRELIDPSLREAFDKTVVHALEMIEMRPVAPRVHCPHCASASASFELELNPGKPLPVFVCVAFGKHAVDDALRLFKLSAEFHAKGDA